MSPTHKRVLLGSWILIVLPLTALGYGSDGDAWRVARVAEVMWRTGRYAPSRSLGFPFFEIGVTPLVHFGQWYASNLFAFGAGLALLGALFRLADRGQFVHPVPVVATIAFLPVMVKNTSSTMDYVPALAVLLWSYVALVEDKPLRAALLIGLAAGFRLTSSLWVVPVLAYAYRARKDPALLVRIFGVAFVASVLAYSPRWIPLGLPSTGVTARAPTVVLLLQGMHQSLQLLGLLPSVALGLALLAGLRRAIAARDSWLASPAGLFQFATIGIFVLAYWASPVLAWEPEYLLPVVPSLIFLLDRLSGRRVFMTVLVVLLAHHVIRVEVLGGESGARRFAPSIQAGYTVADIQWRRFILSLRRAAAAYAPDRPTVLLYGLPFVPVQDERWEKVPGTRMVHLRNTRFYLSDPILDGARLRELSNQGFRIVIWRGAKWEYMYDGPREWKRYVEIIDDFDTFFGVPLAGRPLH